MLSKYQVIRRNKRYSRDREIKQESLKYSKYLHLKSSNLIDVENGDRTVTSKHEI